MSRPSWRSAANSAQPHYEPHPGKDAALRPGDVVLLDLWAGKSRTTVFADQTWVAFAGSRPPEKLQRVWDSVRGARDAAIRGCQRGGGQGQQHRGVRGRPGGSRGDRRSRLRRCVRSPDGHSIDRDLHGSGPHLDDYETHDDRLLVPGIGFSVEPGIYLSGEFGMRSEVNVFWLTPAPKSPRGAPAS